MPGYTDASDNIDEIRKGAKVATTDQSSAAAQFAGARRPGVMF